MDYRKKVFEMLGVEPKEQFKIQMRDGVVSKECYFIDEDLKGTLATPTESEQTVYKFVFLLQDILCGTTKIIKIVKMTKKEQIAIDYARACDCRWIAKDKVGDVYAYQTKPKKNPTLEVWGYELDKLEVLIPISFVKWEDEEPYYIGNIGSDVQ